MNHPVHVPPQSPLSPQRPTPTSKAPIKMIVAWTVGLTLLAWLLSRTPFSEVREAITRPSIGIWTLTLGGLLLSYGLRSARLQVVLALDDHNRAPRRWLGLRTDALRVILMHNAAVNLLPMRAGELSFPWLASRELNLPLARAVACLLWMRVQDLIVLITLGVLLWPGVALLWRGTALTAMVLGWWIVSWGLRRWYGQHPEAHTPKPAASTNQSNKMSHVLQRLRHALLEPAHHRPMAWLLTLANWSVKLAAGACLLSAISGSNWGTAWSGALGGELAAVVPLQGPAGFGTYEAGVWAGMAAHLSTQSPALALAVSAALALHVCFLLCAVLAGAVAWLLGHLSSDPTTQQKRPPRQTL
ncbi:MAG: flippase-like domain-containing protein [Aquabacterium sp.]|uniref:lysylphosphatidylglycerol synthase transmembrane domain-containing protein n=1 Tax=Aquabacterium sp. TaxID=1872578 RepID=UPI001B7C5D59|nr:lysylphosphatidylglycerol synthase transmembrane domain-containing protein [Aquabacterium sp.]MBP7132179.1 flippase-like domain-containing protein [Aquabacterium sp.]MBP9062615.1 flippase-like domain-containing protein [Aquabacterium sp.]